MGVRNRALIRCRLTTRLLLLNLRAGDTVGRKKGDQLLFTESEAEGTESDTELMVIEVAVAIEIEESELLKRKRKRSALMQVVWVTVGRAYGFVNFLALLFGQAAQRIGVLRWTVRLCICRGGRLLLWSFGELILRGVA